MAAPAAPAKACTTADFADSRPGSTHYRAITWLRCEGLSAGYSDGSYGVRRNITRGEAASLIYRYSGDKHNAGKTRDFKDVSPGKTHFIAISWMKAEGITAGYKNGTFGINKPISRGELAAFLYRASGEKFSAPSKSPYKDMSRSSGFYGPATWLYDTGLVRGYADGTFKSTRAVTRGETAAFMYALETRAKGAAPTYKVPARVAQGTGGTGGVYHDKQNLSWSNGTHTSRYHLYADGLDRSKPMGVVMFLHGDGAGSFNYPNQSTIQQYRSLAKAHNLIFVLPKTPNPKGTWWLKESNKYTGKWVTDLFDHLGTKYNVDLNRTYWLGFSGGADVITEQIMQTHSDGWTGGAALIMSGGPGEWGYHGPYKPISSKLKANFKMHWVVGAKDYPGAGAGDDGYDALHAARDGYKKYTSRGMKTTITEIPNTGHSDAFPKGPAYFKKVLEGKM